MPPDERLEVIHAAWESFSSQTSSPVSPEELELVDQRIREHEANPEDGVPWEVIKAELWPDL